MIPSRFIVLCCAFAATLAGCSEQRSFLREKYTGERYGDPVTGGRRPPVLNPEYAKQNRPVVPPAIVPQKMPPANANLPAMPYDQYDAKGNLVAAPSSAPASKTTPVPTPQAVAPQVVLPQDAPSVKSVATKPGRKAFAGSGAAMQPVEPVTFVPQAPPKNQPPAENQLIPPAPDVKAVPALKEENGVFVEDPEKRVDRHLQPIFLLADVRPALAYPHLADVPKTPAVFHDIKRRKDSDAADLKSEYDRAMEMKKRLAEEPTNLPVQQDISPDGRPATTG